MLLISGFGITGNYRIGVYIDEITKGPNNIFTHIFKIVSLGLVFLFPYSRVLIMYLENTFDSCKISTECIYLKS